MESTPAQRNTDSPFVGQYASLGTSAAELGDKKWGDIMMDEDNGPRTPPAQAVFVEEISPVERLIRYAVDLLTEGSKYGEDLETELDETSAELESLGLWDALDEYLVYLEEVEKRVNEERDARLKELQEMEDLAEQKRLEHALKIAAMEKAAREQVEAEKAAALAAIAARHVTSTKNGTACKYYRNDGSPEPASKGWEPGCGYHKEGKCKHVHPDEPGWDEAVAKRKAEGHKHKHGHHKKPAGGAGRW